MMTEENNSRRKYVLDKLSVKNKDISDEDLMEKLLEEKDRLFRHYSLLSSIIPEQDF